jgi:hypothetical protein
MSTRRGLSVTEVLIAIFVMAIGMISLLALFPIGMLRMAWAIRDNRLANATGNSEAVLEGHNIRADATVISAATSDTNLAAYFTDPNAPHSANSPPVLVDPIGCFVWPDGSGYGQRTGVRPTAIGPSFGIRRSPTAGAPANAPRSLLYRWFTLEDDVAFDTNGMPLDLAPNPGIQVARERRYSWAYLWRRPRWSEASVVDISIILYSGRQLTGLGGSPQEYSATGPAATNGRVFVAGQRQAYLAWGNTQQAVRPGYWVLDATMIAPSGPGQPNWYLNGFFYQVTNVYDPDAAGNQIIEIDRPARADGYVAVFPIGIVDVIEKSNGRLPD